MSANRKKDQTHPGERQATQHIYSTITIFSRSVTFAFVISMMIVMVIEVFMRYIFGNPLGWSSSLIEKFLLPGTIFIGLPWAYATNSHVVAELVYDRLPFRVRQALDWLALILVLLCLGLLAWAGANMVVEAVSFGDTPPPLSSQVPLATWTWRTFLPLGTALTLILMIIDLPSTTKATGDSR